ncbi:hypothetical protein GOFOIKOB_6500 [Methylobacterium tardum]|uniref:DUF6894 domain-containing protein n=1 Tax=Methylobacterium tardum TaxID=374432 RepID=A0AA37WRR9_9HYPH|nr:hypothetical protein [Methylobacterium tardum]URD35210.1 hypothetical protein M6G65_22150 [Methylobacterium tardum]GJE53421.1 hypothetical protein GOFOIKOB_6500 [Methylobacterium tardum]GLS70389.1 hypothetical protein GCM10007890_24020 [Methylobacterium tardum]
MPRFFFDIHDGEFQRDEEGLECENVEAARDRVMASLSDVAELITSGDGDNQAVTVTVRDEEGSRVYTGTLTFTASRLDEAAS